MKNVSKLYKLNLLIPTKLLESKVALKSSTEKPKYPKMLKILILEKKYTRIVKKNVR